jgi:hypothetical protein
LTMKYSCLPDHSSQGVITRVSTYLAAQIRRTTSLPSRHAYPAKTLHQQELVMALKAGGKESLNIKRTPNVCNIVDSQLKPPFVKDVFECGSLSICHGAG